METRVSEEDGLGPPRLEGMLGRLDWGLTKAETWFVTFAVALEVSALCLWVSLNGFATPQESESSAGIIIRGVLASLALAAIAVLSTRRRSATSRRIAVTGAGVAGFGLAWFFRGVGVDYASNVLNWLQQASSLTLVGGLRGVGTRLTLVLALVGASLAAGAGKHITIDLATRWVSGPVRRGLETATWVASAGVCILVSWGFFDHIAIESFGAPRDAGAREKAAVVLKGLDEHAFILARQLELDVSSVVPVLVLAKPYSAWMSDREWNAWLDDGGFVERYGREAVEVLRLRPGDTRAPMIAVPEIGEPRGELINAANLVLPFGLFAIALRMLLRAARTALEPELDRNADPGGEGEVMP